MNADHGEHPGVAGLIERAAAVAGAGACAIRAIETDEPLVGRASAARPAAVARELDRGFMARWMPAWKIKTSGSAYRINFDIHRAFGLWTWALLFIIAFTAFSLNLNFEVFSPIMRSVSNYTPI